MSVDRIPGLGLESRTKITRGRSKRSTSIIPTTSVLSGKLAKISSVLNKEGPHTHQTVRIITYTVPIGHLLHQQNFSKSSLRNTATLRRAALQALNSTTKKVWQTRSFLLKKVKSTLEASLQEERKSQTKKLLKRKRQDSLKHQGNPRTPTIWKQDRKHL